MKSTVQYQATAAPAAKDRGADRLAIVLDRYLHELETTGVPPDLDRLVAEYPDLADELRSYVESLQVLHQMTAGLRVSPSPNGAAAAHARRLGDYEILREIGRGGMGIVYEARQISLNRPVALKVLPFAAMLDDRQIARFRTEAQAAAQLHHPNIVPVYAVGQERGVHYFAMQYVAGQSLEQAIYELGGANEHAAPSTSVGEDPSPRRNPAAARDRDTAHDAAFSTKVSTRNRNYGRSVARLVVQAAEALQHAHEYGVIHRDVKPSNLLLDRDGTLWVSDFGLARVQSDAGITLSGDVVGTIRYMSPEQAAGDSARLDARADVYSLGATMYELLTLQRAHRGDGRQEILRNIESVDPVNPRSINPAIPFDLETIVMRCLAKSRDERYSTARELADDLRRFLAGEPTLARRPTALDRTAKWALRHRKMVSLAAAFMLLLTLVSVTAAVMIARAQSRTEAARQELSDNLERVEEHYQQARAVVDRFSDVANELAGLPGAEPLRRQLLSETLDHYRQFIVHAANDPELTSQSAITAFKAAAIAEALGERREATAMCRQALAAFDRLASSDPDDEQLLVQRSKCHNALGLLLATDGDADGAIDAYSSAIAELKPVVERGHSDNAAAVRSLADAYSNLGLLEGQLGQKDEAKRYLTASIGMLESFVTGAPEEPGPRHELAIGYNNLSFVQRDSDWSASERSCRRAIEILQKLVDEDAATLAFRSDLALCLNNLGAILGHKGEWPDACEAYERAIAIQRPLTRQAAAVVNFRRDLAVSLNNLGQAYDAMGNVDAAIASFDEAQEIIALLVEDYPEEATFRSLCGAAFNNRAMILEKSGPIDDALSAYRSAIENQRIAHERAPQAAEFRDNLSKHLFNYGRVLRAAGEPRKAAEVALERRGLWPEHGEHLGQIAVELAQAVAQLHQEPDSTSAGDESKRLGDEVEQTLRAAAAHGCDLTALRGHDAFQSLQLDAIWGNLADTNDADAP